MEKNYATIKLQVVTPIISLSGGALRLLFIIIRDADYPGRWDKSKTSSVNKLKITPISKNAWCQELSLSISSINNFITELIKKKIIRKEDLGVYLLNPEVAYKGPSIKEAEAIKQFSNG